MGKTVIFEGINGAMNQEEKRLFHDGDDFFYAPQQALLFSRVN